MFTTQASLSFDVVIDTYSIHIGIVLVIQNTFSIIVQCFWKIHNVCNSSSQGGMIDEASKPNFALITTEIG